jgi:hypothetical protein
MAKYDSKAKTTHTTRDPDTRRQHDWKRDRYEQRKLKNVLRDRGMKEGF